MCAKRGVRSRFGLEFSGAQLMSAKRGVRSRFGLEFSGAQLVSVKRGVRANSLMKTRRFYDARLESSIKDSVRDASAPIPSRKRALVPRIFDRGRFVFRQIAKTLEKVCSGPSDLR
jgi:hypothetical protein